MVTDTDQSTTERALSLLPRFLQDHWMHEIVVSDPNEIAEITKLVRTFKAEALDETLRSRTLQILGALNRSALSQTPPELVQKILFLVVPEEPIYMLPDFHVPSLVDSPQRVLSLVCKDWHKIIRERRRFCISVKLESTTYPTALSQIKEIMGPDIAMLHESDVDMEPGMKLSALPPVSFTIRCSMSRWDRVIDLECVPGIVTGYAPRISELYLTITIDAMDSLLRLSNLFMPVLELLCWHARSQHLLPDSKYLMYDPAENYQSRPQPLSILAPRLKKLIVEAMDLEDYLEWPPRIQPCLFGLDLERTTELDLQTAMTPEHVDQLLIKACDYVTHLTIYLRKYGSNSEGDDMDSYRDVMDIDDEMPDEDGDGCDLDSGEGELQLTESNSAIMVLKELVHLSVICSARTEADSFLSGKEMPKLKSLCWMDINQAAGYSHPMMMEMLRRSQCQLLHLELRFTVMSVKEIEGLFSSTLHLTSLVLEDSVVGWKVLLSPRSNLLLPSLIHFKWENFQLPDVDDLISFINLRGPNGSWNGPAVLRYANLICGFPIKAVGEDAPTDSVGRKIHGALENWRKRGLKVDFSHPSYLDDREMVEV